LRRLAGEALRFSCFGLTFPCCLEESSNQVFSLGGPNSADREPRPRHRGAPLSLSLPFYFQAELNPRSEPGKIPGTRSWRTSTTFPIATPSWRRKTKGRSPQPGINLSRSRCAEIGSSLMRVYQRAGSCLLRSLPGPRRPRGRERGGDESSFSVRLCLASSPEPICNLEISLGLPPPQSQRLATSTTTGRAPSSQGGR